MAIVLITAYRLSAEEEREVKEQADADKLMYKPLPAMPELRAILDDIVDKRRKMRDKEAAKQKTNVVVSKEDEKPSS
jgi:hypothetical protein